MPTITVMIKLETHPRKDLNKVLSTSSSYIRCFLDPATKA